MAASSRNSATKRTPAKKATPSHRTRAVKKTTPAKKASTPARKTTPAKKTAPAKKAVPAKASARKTTPVKKTAVKKSTGRSAAKPSAPVKKAAVKKTAVKKSVPVHRAAPISKTVAKKPVAAKKAAPAKKTAAKKGTAAPVSRGPIDDMTKARKPRSAAGKKAMNDTLIETLAPLFNDDLTLTQKWINFKVHGSPTAREELIVHYVSLVRYAVSRMNLALPSSLDRHDLYGYGVIGLMDAMEKFDLDRGLKFETYAVTRIKGAILDELRTLDWVPRSVRTKIRAVDKVTVELEHELGRTPTDDEIADRAGMTASEVRSVMTVYANTYVGTLDEQSHGSTGEAGNEDTKASRIVDKSDLLPGEAFEESETRFEVADHIRNLDDRERAVVALYYFEGLTLAEVGKVLGVTESRVCQIHTKALNSLRNDKKLLAAGM